MGLSCSSEMTSPLKFTQTAKIKSSSHQNGAGTNAIAEIVKMSEGDSGDFEKFLSRIASFFNDEGVNHLWLSKPQSLSPPNCAIFGWRLTSCNMLTCELCGAKLFAEISTKLPAHIARKCLKEIERNLRSGHTKGCAYRFAPCPDEFKYVSAKAASTLVADFQQRLDSLKVLSNDLPFVTLEEFDYLEKIKTDSELKNTPTELVILALMGWEHHSTAYNKFVFIKCGYCFRKVCTMFYRRLTREEELLIEEAEQRMLEVSKDGSPANNSQDDNLSIPAFSERKRRGSKDILDAKVSSIKKKRKPQDQLNPCFEHRSWCAWISKPNRESPVGWRVLLELLIAHHKRAQDDTSPQNVPHEAVMNAAETALNNIRRRSSHWQDRDHHTDENETLETLTTPNQDTLVLSTESS